MVLSAPSFGAKEGTLDSLIVTACEGVENCENEGRLVRRQGRPLNEIINRMCRTQPTGFQRVSCFQISYRQLRKLKPEELQRTYEFDFSGAQLKSYYIFVQNNCLNLPCQYNKRVCENIVLECWSSYSLTLEIQLRLILEDLAKRR